MSSYLWTAKQALHFSLQIFHSWKRQFVRILSIRTRIRYNSLTTRRRNQTLSIGTHFLGYLSWCRPWCSIIKTRALNVANLLFRLNSWLIHGYFWQRHVFVRAYILTRRYVRDKRARIVATHDRNARSRFYGCSAWITSYRRTSHTNTRVTRIFKKRKIKKSRSAFHRPRNRNEVRLCGTSLCIRIKDTMFRFSCFIFHATIRIRQTRNILILHTYVFIYFVKLFSSLLDIPWFLYVHTHVFSRFSITRS